MSGNKILYFLKDAPKLKFAFLVILFVVVAVLMFSSRSLVGRKSFVLEDKCGRFMNLVSHTISNDETCRMRCRAQCDADGYRFESSVFIESLVKCNSCKCVCA